ncbi:MAG: signal peptidase I [Spirochaetota bacterium]|nr:MAG: signal peptidase I [Spirochaetota bacterium]
MAKKPKRPKSKLRENIEAIVFALAIALFIKAFIVDVYKIPTGSMIPTIEVGDFIVATKFIYGAKVPFTNKRLPAVRDPKRGDIVIFLAPYYDPPNIVIQLFTPVVYTLTLGFVNIDPQPKFYVKRCIGIPGDEVEVINKEVYVNKKLMKGWWPEYHSDPEIIPPGDSLMNNRDFYGPVVVPEDQYFMMGDNRDSSNDSRFWGFVDRSEIFGKSLFRYWPPARMGVVK